jgi:hypothetical protein
MRHDWKIRVGPAEKKPYHFKATFVLDAADSGPMDVCYLYGDGDLAVFLEDLGAGVPAIWSLLDTLHGQKTAEIGLDVTEEAMEVLARRRPAARA